MLKSRWLVSSILGASVLLGAPAYAQDQTELEKARVLFSEARTLMNEGQFGEACARFEQSLRLEAGAGTKFNLADCWERIGRTASAQALFAGVAADAEVRGQAERARIARERAAALEPWISRLIIEVEGAAPDISVRSNRVVVEESSFGAAVAVDPGPYQIEARAPGRARWTKRVEVPGNGSVVSVSIPTLASSNPEPAGAPAPVESEKLERPASTLALAPRTNLPPRSHSSSGSSSLTNGIAIGLGTLGVGGLVLGMVSALKYRSSDADARDICADGGTCTRANIDQHDKLVQDSRDARTWAFVGFGAGTAAIAGAALLYFTNRTGSSEAPPASVGAMVLPNGSWSLQARGGF